MNCFQPQYIRTQNIRSKRCDQQLKLYNRRYLKENKVLLLGGNESGKSTFIRQMRILYGKGYSKNDRESEVKTICQNIINSMQTMIRAMQLLGIEYEKLQNLTTNSIIIMQINGENAKILEDPYLTAIKELWHDAGIQNCYMRRREYRLNTSAKYFLKNIDRISEAHYLPNYQDIIRMRKVTKNMTELKFNMRNRNINMINVGNQLTNHHKWIHCFDNANLIIFLADISKYDEVIDDRNCLKESINYLENILSKFDETKIILLLNKADIFDEKLQHSHLYEYFPDYKGPQCDAYEGRKFILDTFLKIKHRTRICNHYFISATDTEHVKVIFNVLSDGLKRY